MSESEPSVLAVCANELEALCPAPPEEDQAEGEPTLYACGHLYYGNNWGRRTCPSCGKPEIAKLPPAPTEDQK